MTRRSGQPDAAPDPGDRALVSAAEAGDRQARRELAKRLLKRVRHAVYYLAPGDREQDDLVQIALVEILRSTGGYRGEGRLESWADRIVVRTVRRRLARRHADQHLELDIERAAGPGRDPEHETARRQLGQALAQLLERMPSERRTAVVLRLVFSYSIPEIAEMTEAKANTVRDRLRAGRQELREMVLRRPELCEWLERAGLGVGR